MSVRLLEPAQQELNEAIAWYASQEPGHADAEKLLASISISLTARSMPLTRL